MQWQVGVILIWLYLAVPAVAQCNPEWCGSKNVSYPFWIQNSNCGLPGFQIKCMKNQNGNWSLFLGTFVNSKEREIEILELSYVGYLILNSTDLKAMSCGGTDDAFVLFELPRDGPFTISCLNKFVVIGCKSKGSFNLKDGGGKCESACLSQRSPNYCNTYGCCEAGIPGSQRMINFTGGGIPYKDFSACGFSTILEPGTWYLPGGEPAGFLGAGHYGLRLEWGIGDGNCSTAKGTPHYSCVPETKCLNAIASGHLCECLRGYQGTGYSNGTGCTDVDECSHRDLNQCVEPSHGGICNNLPGSYRCSCARYYSGDGFQNGTRCQSLRSNKSVIKYATIGSVSSFVVVCLAASLLVWWLKKRHLKLVEAKYFQQLQRFIASRVGRESLRMFSAKELARASNNYSKEMVLGSGGFGTVFKGILLDGTLVAIKKSKQALNLEDDHEFLNEIAIETGEALAYLHSGASQPIFHRDVKSSNILLNEKFSPKVADFGISRLISTSNNTHVTTYNIKGTRGYLDPEFFQTSQLTEKSDVYSFGVVLVELLTALKPISVERDSEDINLSCLFLSRLDHNRLKEILDNKVLDEENVQQMEEMARIARECLHLERRKRPSMKRVVEELAWIRGGTRKTKFDDTDDEIFEQTSISRESSRTSSEFSSFDFPSAREGTWEEPFTAQFQMSTLL
ncbi:hypothetical protein SUGI_0460420 [Cryptomeria japonica]|nr:hypothetical protein SUGI_0460420 [Cryptomeria japonica]